MLIPVLSAVSYTKSSKVVYLRDITGAYNVTTNPGGYGAPNATSPPAKVGFKFRFWDDTADTLNFVTANTDFITELLSVSGRKFDAEVLGNGIFKTGIHHVKYYPFEASDSIITLTQNSDVATVTAGTDPSDYDSAYKAALLMDGSGNIVSNVILISDKTSTTFKMDSTWTEDTETGYTMMLGTEADLKIYFDQLAVKCITERIGGLPTNKDCDHEYVNHLVELTAWQMAAKVKFSCKDYGGAHDLITAVEKECTNCYTPYNCQSCSS